MSGSTRTAQGCPRCHVSTSHRPSTTSLHKGSIGYYGKLGVDRLIRVDFHGSHEVPKGTCHAILKAAGIRTK